MDDANLDDKLDKLLDIIGQTILGAKRKGEAAAVPLWPIPTPQGMLYWGNEWSKKLYRVLNLIDQQKIKEEEIKKAVKFPSRIVHILWRTDAVKESELGKDEKLYLVKKLFDYLAVFRKDDLWCEKGENPVWGLKELVGHRESLVFFFPENKEACRLLFRFEASLLLYTELLYWANHPLGHSFHGPYINEEELVLVRDYFDLKPDVWDFPQGLNFSQVEIFEVYRGGTEIKLDFFERGIRTIEPFRQNLVSFALKINGKPVKQREQLFEALENLREIIKTGSELIGSLNEQQLIEKHAEYWFYALKPFCDLVGEDWCPPQSVRDNIYKRYDEIRDVWENVVKKRFEKTASLSLSEQKKILRESFDPRN